MTIGSLGPSRDIVKVVCVGSRFASARVPQLPTEVWINKAGCPKLFGNSAEFWLNLQGDVDLWDAARGLKHEIAHIQPPHRHRPKHEVEPTTPIDPHRAHRLNTTFCE